MNEYLANDADELIFIIALISILSLSHHIRIVTIEHVSALRVFVSVCVFSLSVDVVVSEDQEKSCNYVYVHFTLE